MRDAVRDRDPDDALDVLLTRQALQLRLVKVGFGIGDVVGSRERTVSHTERNGIIDRVHEWFANRIWWLYPPLLDREVAVSESPGMSEKEAWRYLIMHDEHEQIRAEQSKKESRKIERKAKSAGSGSP